MNWSVLTEERKAYYAGMSHKIVDPDGSLVGLVYIEAKKQEESLRRAHVVAASPELNKSLQELVEILEELGWSDIRIGRCVVKANDALAKANPAFP